jgi:protein-disulfide isomerase
MISAGFHSSAERRETKMKTSLPIALVSLTLLMQAVILYKQYTGGPARNTRQSPIRDAASGTLIDVTGLPSQGDMAAKVVLVEFSDYECPFCARHAAEAGPEVYKEFVATGKLRYAFANLPLDIHPRAKPLAVAAICAGQQDRYWEMRDLLFADKPKSNEEIAGVAKKLGVNVTAFNQCLETPGPLKQIERDVRLAEELKLTATPAFAIGLIGGSGHVKVEKLISGALPFETFKKTIVDILAKSAA